MDATIQGAAMRVQADSCPPVGKCQTFGFLTFYRPNSNTTVASGGKVVSIESLRPCENFGDKFW